MARIYSNGAYGDGLYSDASVHDVTAAMSFAPSVAARAAVTKAIASTGSITFAYAAKVYDENWVKAQSVLTFDEAARAAATHDAGSVTAQVQCVYGHGDYGELEYSVPHGDTTDSVEVFFALIARANVEKSVAA